MSGVPPEAIHAALARAGFGGAEEPPLALIQTHISWVFLGPRDVFKIKKPVRFSFLDFSQLAKRRYFCAEELRLNRRLAGDVYVDVVGLRPCAEGLELCSPDDPAVCEVAVHMRRLPSERMLPCLLERGEVDGALVARIAERLVAFHETADAGLDVRAAGDPEVVRRQLLSDFDEMERFRGVAVGADTDARIQTYCLRELERHGDLLRSRQASGRVRDGHGDLHAEHICVLGERSRDLVIFDCIEFNPAFRCRDVAGEVAFLAMDLEYRGRQDLAEQFVAAYAERAADDDLQRLVPMFACHRAYIRGKVDSLKSAEPEVPAEEQRAAVESARRHFLLANTYTWRDTPTLVIVGGLSGTGKSTVARGLAARTGFERLSSDEIRKELAGIAPTSRVGARDDAGLYSPAQSARTYGRMLERAEACLVRRRGVILDATFARFADREVARALGAKHGIPVTYVECVCPQGEVERRLEARTRANDDPSDADVAIYRRQRTTYEASRPGEGVVLNTGSGAAAAVATAEQALATRNE